MKIEFGTHLLSQGELHREDPIDLTVTSTRLVQDIHLINSPESKPIDRGNIRHTLRFQIVKKHDSVEDAIAHALMQASTLEGLEAPLKITLEEEKKELIKLRFAVMKRVESSVKGPISIDRYEIVGGLFEQTSKGESL